MLSEKIKNVSEQYSAWWEGTNKNALINCTYFDQAAFTAKVAKYQKEWMQERYWWILAWAIEKSLAEENVKYLNEALDIIEVQYECEGYAGAGFPSFFTNLGAGCIAAVISGYSRYYNDTIWFELNKPMEWEQILTSSLKDQPPYADMASKAVELVCERLKDIAVVSMLDLGGVVDVLASLRRTDNLLTDVVDYPEEIKQSVQVAQSIWKDYHDKILKILEKNGNNYTSWMSILSDKPYYPSQCDFSAMISPAMFEEFVLPSLSKEMSWFEKGVYHLDGPGQIPHLDLLLSIKNLHAVQWVPMPFQPRHDEMHYGLYKKLIDNGKKIILSGYIADYDMVKKLFSHFPKEAFFLEINCRNREQAEKIASLA